MLKTVSTANGLVSPTFSGNVTLSNGNIVIGTSGKGIDFSATPGTGISELLADYEEGTLAGVVTCGTSGTVALYAGFDTLTYTKVGREVTVQGQLKVESVASPVGFFAIALPFAIGDFTDTAGSFAATVTMQNVNAANVANFVAVGFEGESLVKIYLGDATTLQSDSAQELKGFTDIFLSAKYFV
jgi:hypothetical protein